MGTRGSALDRAIRFFEDSTLREARAAFHIVQEVMQQRLSEAQAKSASQLKVLDKPRKPRKARTTDGTAGQGAAGASAPIEGAAV